MLVGEGRTRQSVWLTVGDDSRDGDVGSGGVGAGDLEVAGELEAESVEGARGENALPVGDEDALVEVGATVGADRAVVGRGGGGVAVGLVVVLPVVLGADVVAVVVLVVKPGEEDVLLEVAGGCTLLGRDEGLDRVALAGGDSGGAGLGGHAFGGEKRRVRDRS